MCGLQGKSLGSDVFYFKGETVRMINEGLSDKREMATDAMICSVAAITHLESLSASPKTVKIHIDGLEALVKSRGGLKEIGSESYGMVRAQAGWTDTLSAIILQTKPRFDPAYSDDYKSVEWPPYSSIAARYKEKLSNLTGMHELSEEAVDIYWNLRCLSALKGETSYPLLPGEVEELVPYTDILQSLERRLIVIFQTQGLVSPTQNMSIFTLFANAAILHIYMFQRHLSKGLPFFHTVSHRVRVVLESVDIKILQTQYPEMLLWILMMGGLCGVETCDRGWFAKLLADLCIESGIHGGNQIAAELSDFFWSELYRSPMTMGFWKDLATAQGFKGKYEMRRVVDNASMAIFNVPVDTGEWKIQ